MSEPHNPPPPRQTDRWLEPGAANVQVIYILYLAGFVIGITPLIGVIIAYVNRGKSEPWLETHYTWAIRTFWICLLYSVVGFVLAFVLIGFLVLLGTVIWFIVRVVVGLQAIGRNEPMSKPDSWMF